MRSILKSALLIISVIAVLSASGCAGGIKGSEAREHINGFFEAIESEDYELAAEFLHPERPADIEVFFEGIEIAESVNFSEGIEITDYTGISTSYYDSTVGGSTYSLTMDVQVGTQDGEMEIEIVKNKNGYGIYNIDVDF